MVSLSLPISTSRSSSDHVSSKPPSLNCQASVYSSDSYTYYRDASKNNSLEELLSPLKKSTRLQNKHLNIARGKKSKKASNGTGAVVLEQKKSYGIGGAGNIRRPSEVIYPPRVDADGTQRTSVWSNLSSSPEGGRASIMSLFRKNSVPSEPARGEVSRTQFNPVDSGRAERKKKVEDE